MSHINSNNTSTHRQCSLCGEIKELNKDNYSRDKSMPFGFAYKCRKCKQGKSKGKYIPTSELSPEKLERRRFLGRKYWKDPNKKIKNKSASIKTWDTKHGLENDITDDYLEKSLNSPCNYCGFPSTGLDRLDNNIGHLMSNCVPCCKECNIARNNNFSSEEMKTIGQAIKLVKLNRIFNNK